MPTFKLGKRFLVSFAAFKKWDSLFPASDDVLEARTPGRTPTAGHVPVPAQGAAPARLDPRIVEVRIDEVAREG